MDGLQTSNFYKVLLAKGSILGFSRNKYCARNVCSHLVFMQSMFFSKLKVFSICGFSVGKIAAVRTVV